MAKWRYRKSIKIAPGIRMNLSSKGVGFSAGVPGARIGISGDRKRVTLTQSIPGTGLRKQQSFSTGRRNSGDNQDSNYQALPPESSSFSKIFAEKKRANYKIHKYLILLNSLMILLILFFVHDEQSPLGGVAAINFMVLFYAIPAFLIIRGRAIKKSRFEADLIDIAVSKRKTKLEFSEYSQAPISLEEKNRVIDDITEIVRLSQLSAQGTSDNSVAPDYLSDAGEVVFFTVDGLLTNFDGVKVADQGTIYISNQKVTFRGLRKNQDWLFEKMDAPMPLESKGIAVFQVSNRKTVTGVAVSPDEWIRFEYFLLNAFASYTSPSEHLSQMTETLQKYREIEVI